MICAKCATQFNRSQVINGECPNCRYYDEDFDTDEKADFRAFRRQVLLAVLSGRRMDLCDWIPEDMWADANRIARAEPKE